jgi:hypothetical protein
MFLARRAVCTVISIFRNYGAVSYNKALNLNSMGLGPRSFFNFRILKDYKPWALQTLMRSGIIRMADEGNYYLSEDTLEANPPVQTACQNKKLKV